MNELRYNQGQQIRKGEEMAEGKTVYSVLAQIQAEISVPKSRFNKFGGYSYRSLEDINAVLKPLCAAHGAGYAFSDTIVPMLVGEKVRWYLKSTLTFWTNTGETLEVEGWAREPDDKKGMDPAQVTGLASSYARKYAACAMFAIDSGEEVDALDNSSANKAVQGKHGTKTPSKPETPRRKALSNADADQLNELTSLVDVFAGMTGKSRTEVVDALGKSKTMEGADLASLTSEEADRAIALMKQWIEKKGGENA